MPDLSAKPGLAALNHPNIAAIYGVEEAGGVNALVMELVEGSTLADRPAQGAIPVDESLLMAKQIADALEAAHEHGIAHRDLKPANIKVREDSTVKILDFGLAKTIGHELYGGAEALIGGASWNGRRRADGRHVLRRRAVPDDQRRRDPYKTSR